LEDLELLSQCRGGERLCISSSIREGVAGMLGKREHVFVRDLNTTGRSLP
jgi:hypothetical protein